MQQENYVTMLNAYYTMQSISLLGILFITKIYIYDEMKKLLLIFFLKSCSHLVVWSWLITSVS